MTTSIEEICEIIKEKGPNYAIISLDTKLELLEIKLGEIERKFAHKLYKAGERISNFGYNGKQAIESVRTDMNNIAEKAQEDIRAKTIVHFESNDVWEVNKRIEKLQQQIELLKIADRENRKYPYGGLRLPNFLLWSSFIMSTIVVYWAVFY